MSDLEEEFNPWGYEVMSPEEVLMGEEEGDLLDMFTVKEVESVAGTTDSRKQRQFI